MDSQVIFDNNHPKGASKEIKGHKIKPKIIKVISKSIKVENFKHTICNYLEKRQKKSNFAALLKTSGHPDFISQELSGVNKEVKKELTDNTPK